MQKDQYYWKEHKKILQQELDKLDENMINIILNLPHGVEAKSFNRRVHRVTQGRMMEEYYV